MEEQKENKKEQMDSKALVIQKNWRSKQAREALEKKKKENQKGNSED